MITKDKGFFGDMHPFMKLLILGFIVFFSLIVVFFLGSLLALPFIDVNFINLVKYGLDYKHLDDVVFLKYFQILSHIGLFIVPSILFAFLVGESIKGYYGLWRKTDGRLLFLSALIMFAAVPLINFLIELNMQMTLPGSLSKLEEWMRKYEDSAMELTELFLDVTTVQGLLFNIFMIAVIPAIGEEFLFRGIVLKVFGQWSRSIHVGVWISAILFSAMHMQFYGFLPRLFLGILLGYIFVWGRSIWFPVFAHFLNNALAVTVYYLVNIGYWNVEYEDLGKETTGIMYVVVSAVIVIAILFVFYRKAQDHNKFGFY